MAEENYPSQKFCESIRCSTYERIQKMQKNKSLDIVPSGLGKKV